MTYEIYSVLIIFCITKECPGLDYCNSSFCQTNKYDSLCKLKSSDPARHCIDVEEIIRTDGDRKSILDKINSRRNKVASGEIRSLPAASNMIKLEWSKELERSAQKWANQCIKTSHSGLKDPCRDIGNVTVGQNIATITGESPGLILSALVDIWYMELLSFNTSLTLRFRGSSVTGHSHYDYFTQLVWAETKQVGCGAVKFKVSGKFSRTYVTPRFSLHWLGQCSATTTPEILEGDDNDKGQNRTVYRLVCNFAPGGNMEHKQVYAYGIPCSQCSKNMICDSVYKALCGTGMTENKVIFPSAAISSRKQVLYPTTSEVIDTTSSPTQTINDSTSTEDDTLTLFDYFSHLREFTIPIITMTALTTKCDENILAVDDFVDLLKKKLSSDSAFKDLLFATKFPVNFNFTETPLPDPNVASFVNRIYSKKESPTTTKITENDLINSTLLVDLVEAVIFRSGEKISTSVYSERNVLPVTQISPVKIQAELSQTQQNNEFSGHYFFPEDDDDETTYETTEAYYDASAVSISDVFEELDNIKKSRTTNHFLEDILDFDSSTESTTSENPMSPDDKMSTYSGRNVMKKFLEDIKNKTTG